MGDAEREIRERLGEKVSVERFLRRESQEALAARAGINRVQISLIETGQRTMLLTTFVRLCGALELSPDELLDGISFDPGRFNHGVFRIVGDKVWKQ